MDAASLAALALRPRAPELYRQWREDPASLPELKQENPSSAQAMAARALRPRFGPGASSATAIPLMRSGPRSAADLAKLDPATLAALALQPRAPQMRQQWQALKAAPPASHPSGLSAATLQPPDDWRATGFSNVGPSINTPAFATPNPDLEFHSNPDSYLQPSPFVPRSAAATPTGVPEPLPAVAAGPDINIKANPNSLLQPTPVSPAPDSSKAAPNPLLLPTENDPQRPITPEQQERMNLWRVAEKNAHGLGLMDQRHREVAKIPNYSGDGEPFPSRVESTLSNTVPYLKLLFAPENRAGLMAGTKFIAEENNDIKGLKGWAIDGMQDWNAGSGHSRHDFLDFHHDEGKLPALRFPEDWVRGNPLQKLATQFEPLLHDVGPANLKVKTAAEMDGTTSAQGVRDLSKNLVTAPGTARVTAGLVHNAMAELHPLIKDKPEEEQAQIIVDYLRKGPEKFWSLTKKNHKLSDEQLHAWKSNPDSFAIDENNKPSLDPNPDHFMSAQFEQLHKIMSNTSSAKPPAMWSPPNY